MDPDEKVAVAPEVENSTGVQKSFLEQLLSPQSLHRMMIAGGGTLVVGFVGWLWSIGLFDNPMTMAALLGGATLFVLAVGIALVRFSRYQQAGTGLTLLASMALPLNLWFYDAQGLVTLADGGHLWIPAAVCCAIYALIARVLRNEVFVYTLVGGIVLTGMLFLADQSIGRFWELLPPATFLIAAGWICIHVERLFAAGDSDFSRDKFGRAFFRCGLVVLAGGFGLLLSGQLMSFFGDFLGYPTLPEIASNRSLKIWALGLVVASTIGSAVESMLGKKRGWVIATLGLTAWSVICLLDVLVLQFQLTIAHLAIVVAIVISFENVLSKGTERAKKFGPLEGLLCLLAICQFASTHLFGQFFGQPLTNSWIGVAQLFTTAVACATGWFRWRRKYGVDTPASGSSLLSMAGVLTVLAAVSAAMALHVGTVGAIAVVALTIPVAIVGYAMFGAKDHQMRTGLQRAASTATTAGLVCLMVLWIGDVSQLWLPSLVWSWILLLASAIYFVAASGRGNSLTQVAGYVAGIAGISQVLTAAGMDFEYALIGSSSVGGAVLASFDALRRKKSMGTESQSGAENVEADASKGMGGLEKPANLLVIGGSVVGILLAFARAIDGQSDAGILLMLVCQLASITVAGLLTKRQDWRLALRATAFFTVAAAIAVLNGVVQTSLVHRIELASILSGIALLVIGHIAWYREGEHHDSAATFCLWCGSLLTAVPLGLGLLAYRSFEVPVSEMGWMFFHEIAAIVVALALAALGCSCRIRSTALAGASLLATYALSLLLIVRWPSQLRSVSLVMMVGGGLFFLTAVLLSVYRDRLVGIHSDMREKRGVFRVLRWR